MLFIVIALAAPPDVPPMDLRITLLETKAKSQAAWNEEANARIEKLEAECRRLQARGSLCPCILNAEANNTPVVVPSFGTAQSCTVDPVTGQMNCAPQATGYQQQQPYYGGSPYMGGGGSCADGSCGPSQGRRGIFRGGLFGRRR